MTHPLVIGGSDAGISAALRAREAGFDLWTVQIGVWDHKVYYPGAHKLHLRITGDRRTGRPGARGVAKSRLALRDRARGTVIGTTEENGPHTRGDVDCVEIVRDEAQVDAIPVVRVTDHQAKVTH